MKRQTKQGQTDPEHAIVYMEVYGMGRIIYRVTAGRMQGKTVYGIFLKDMRTGETACLPSYSEDLEETISFANQLIAQGAKPDRLYDAALGMLCTKL